MDLRFDHDGTEIVLHMERTANGFRIQLPSGAWQSVDGVTTEDGFMNASIASEDDRARRIISMPFVRGENDITFAWGGSAYRFREPGSRPAAETARRGSGRIVSPSSGAVADVFVKVGDTVEEGRQIAIVEAMKVMSVIEADIVGTVRELSIKQGERIEEGAPVAWIEPAPPHEGGVTTVQERGETASGGPNEFCNIRSSDESVPRASR